MEELYKDKMQRGADIDKSWALLLRGFVLGLIFIMAGVFKVFQLGPLEHARKYFLPYADTFLPAWSLWATGVAIPFSELIAGALVMLGLRTREALVGLGSVLVIVTFGHLLKKPLYEFHTHVIPRLALLLFILMLPHEDDRFSVDYSSGDGGKNQNPSQGCFLKSHRPGLEALNGRLIQLSRPS